VSLYYSRRWQNRGGAWAWTPLFCLSIVSLSNTINVRSSDKINRLMKKTLQNFGRMLSILFLAYICNLAGFRNCLAEYTVHSLSPCYTSLSPLVLLNSVARWCNTTNIFTIMVSFYMLVCMGVGRNFSRRAHQWIFPNVFLRKAKSGEIWFLTLGIKKTAFLLKNFSNSCPLPTPICLCVGKVRATPLKDHHFKSIF